MYASPDAAEAIHFLLHVNPMSEKEKGIHKRNIVMHNLILVNVKEFAQLMRQMSYDDILDREVIKLAATFKCQNWAQDCDEGLRNIESTVGAGMCRIFENRRRFAGFVTTCISCGRRMAMMPFIFCPKCSH